jgi:hypothetical protein
VAPIVVFSIVFFNFFPNTNAKHHFLSSSADAGACCEDGSAGVGRIKFNGGATLAESVLPILAALSKPFKG